MKRTSLQGAACPVARSLDAIGDWWSLLIIRDAFNDLRRFGEFQKSLGVAKNILAARLRTLVSCDILAAVPASDGSPYQEYVLTPKGRGLFHVIVGLREWGEDHFYETAPPQTHLVDRAHGRPVGRLELRAADGRLVGPDETVVETVKPAPPRERSPGRSKKAPKKPAAAQTGRAARSVRKAP